MSDERFEVPVDGGSLGVGRWGDGPNVAIASHGITANHLSWLRVAELLVERGGWTLLAVDHRGRAASAAVPGPYGPGAHADDLVAVLDHLSIPSAVFVGHSMGAFVVAAAAERHPQRVERLVLVDGGVPFPMELPADADVEAVVQSVIGPALDRLDQRWSDEDAYVDFFRQHPAFAPPNEWTATVEAYVRHDAVATPEGRVRSSCSKDAVLQDGGAAIVDPTSSSSIERVATPTVMLWAPRGILDQTPGLYPPEFVDAVAPTLPHVRFVEVPGTNHYTVAVGDDGARAVVTAVTSDAGVTGDE